MNRPVEATSKVWRYMLVAIIAAFTLVTLAQSLTIAPFEGAYKLTASLCVCTIPGERTLRFHLESGTYRCRLHLL